VFTPLTVSAGSLVRADLLSETETATLVGAARSVLCADLGFLTGLVARACAVREATRVATLDVEGNRDDKDSHLDDDYGDADGAHENSLRPRRGARSPLHRAPDANIRTARTTT